MKTVILVFAESASGKDYLVKNFISKNPNVEQIVSCTTRPKRDNEINGIDYHFINDDEFDVLKLTGKLIEERTYDTAFGVWRYGTPYFINDYCNKYIGIADIQGCIEIIKAYPNVKFEVYYIKANEKIRTARAMKRGNFSIEEWNRRLIADRKDFSEEKKKELNNVLRQYGQKEFEVIINEYE